MDSPGYDPVSATGQVAGGGNVIVLHDRPRLLLRLQAAPVAQARDQHRHVPAHGGGHGRQLPATIIDGEETVEQVGRAHLRPRGRVASGEKTKTEELGIGDNEFVPWQIGAVM